MFGRPQGDFFFAMKPFSPANPANSRSAHLDYSALADAWTRRRFLASASLASLIPFVARAQVVAGSGVLKPYLQSVEPDAIYVGWRTDTGSETTVLVGTASSQLTRTVNGATTSLSASYQWHLAKIDGLTPGTYYYYQVKTGSEVSAVYRFRTPPERGTKTGRMRFLVVGDNQILNEPRYETILARAKSTIEARFGCPIEESIDFLLNVGDQVDVGTLQHYQYVHLAKVAELSPNLAFMTLVGNHETYSDPSLNLYKTHFAYDHLRYAGIASPGGDTYYSNHVANILFLHLNSEDTSTAQTNWVTQIVGAASIDPSVEWIVSLVHRPYQAEQYVGDISSWFRNTIVPVLARTPKHVLNIGAHHHIYARGQMRDWPVYHIISGGTAWDQYWGQSTERDFDDVTKTIANWAWQILDFDLTNRKLTVECFAEAHPRLGFVYPSTKIDTFHRQFGLAAPATPALLNTVSAPVQLPLALQSSPFTTSTTSETLYSTQFQVASDAAFANKKIDHIRDVVNYYGDTGAPAYTPVNIHAGLDILKYELPANSLPNGAYFARVRHRDTNCEWSTWSSSLAFTVIGSATVESPSITLEKKVYAPNEDILVRFNAGPGNRRDWIGVYKKGQTPGGVNSTTWAYLNGSTSVPATGIKSGSVLFTANIAANQEWYAVFLKDDGYEEIASRVPFFVGTTPTLTAGKTAYTEGEAVQIAYSGAPGAAKDWIGIYRVDQTPGPTPSIQWNYVTGTAGSMSFTGLPKGFYFAVYMVNDGHFEISSRLAFSVGDEIASLAVTNGPSVPFGQPLALTFSNGAGTPKDYIGIFVKDAVPGVDRLVTYIYVGGTTSGSLSLPDELPAGEYFLALFINDSYTAISNRVNVTIVGGPQRPELESVRPGPGRSLIVAVKVQPGVQHRLWQSHDLTLWSEVNAFVGEGLRMEITVPYDSAQGQGFWRVSRP
jgi:acid phosphatase type 7